VLRIFNKYEHGFACVPAIAALKSRGFFDLFIDPPLEFGEIVDRLNANSGYLKVALSMLEGLGWVYQEIRNHYSLTEEAQNVAFVEEGVEELYRWSPDQLYLEARGQKLLSKWVARCIESWGCEEPFSTLLDGPTLIPILIGCHRNGLAIEILGGGGINLPVELSKQLAALFVIKKWAKEDDGGALDLSAVGRFMLDRCLVAGVTASYYPMLAVTSELLFGDTKEIFQTVGSSPETHVDRSLNVRASGFQHQKYFADLTLAIIDIFDRTPIENQPCYVADTGCGNGALLKRIYEVIRDKSERGKHLDTHPVTMVGIDLNHAALVESNKTLEDVPHLLIFGDIADPHLIFEDLKKNGVEEPRSVLHVRSFLDHNRPFVPTDNIVHAKIAFGAIPFQSMAIGPNGDLIPQYQTMQSLVEHLKAWRPLLEGHGLLSLEVHAQSLKAKCEFIEIAEGLHFDLLHAFSLQYLIEPEYYLMAAAQAGLFSDSFYRSYPRGFPYTRITLAHFCIHDARLRYITEQDTDAVASLDLFCSGGKGDSIVASAVSAWPDCQLALESKNGEIVVAVICEKTGEKDEIVVVREIRQSVSMTANHFVLLRHFVTSYFSLKDEVNKLVVEQGEKLGFISDGFVEALQ